MTTIALAFAGIVDYYLALNHPQTDKKNLTMAVELTFKLAETDFVLSQDDKEYKNTITKLHNTFSSILAEICTIYYESPTNHAPNSKKSKTGNVSNEGKPKNQIVNMKIQKKVL